MFKLNLTKWQFADIAQKIFGLKFSYPAMYAIYDYYNDEDEDGDYETCFGDINVTWKEYYQLEQMLEDLRYDSLDDLKKRHTVLIAYDHDDSVYSYLVTDY